MSNNVIHSILTPDEIAVILNDPIVQSNRDKLLLKTTVDFTIPLSDSIKAKLYNALTVDLSQITNVPMRWIKGDTPAHNDRGQGVFNNTSLIYLTDNAGSLIVDGQTHPITSGNAHVFSEGLEHYTINTGNDPRLMIGPMSESGFRVGASDYFISFTTNTFTNFVDAEGFTYTTYSGSPIYHSITIFDIPPPIPVSNPDPFTYPGTYAINNHLNSGDWTPPPGKIFGGWKLMDRGDNGTFINPPTNGIYMPGQTYEYNSNIWLIPNWIDSPVAPICFTAGTPVNTDQGIIPIDKINPKIHTIRNKQIIAITKTTSPDNYLVCFRKNSLGDNIPSQKTIVSKDHLVYKNGKMIKAFEFINNYENVKKIKYNGETLYNVLLENHSTILVNNLICETLHPSNVIAKLYNKLLNCNLEEQSKIIKKYNSKVIKSYPRLNSTKL
jgi:hypothetical protein